jgi:hypothetical protein
MCVLLIDAGVRMVTLTLIHRYPRPKPVKEYTHVHFRLQDPALPTLDSVDTRPILCDQILLKPWTHVGRRDVTRRDALLVCFRACAMDVVHCALRMGDRVQNAKRRVPAGEYQPVSHRVHLEREGQVLLHRPVVPSPGGDAHGGTFAQGD